MKVTYDTEKVNDKIAGLMHMRSRTFEHVDALNELLPTLESNLAKQGLQIDSLTWHKTGTNYDVWAPGDSFRVTIGAVPTAGSKFRFIPFNGYTARGSGRNQAALDTKATKLGEKLGFGCQINPFSLEFKGTETSKSVRIELWVKA